MTLCISELQVGDKVQKGQVICIVEAMKLMNEIEVVLNLLFIPAKRVAWPSFLVFPDCFIVSDCGALQADQSGTIVEIIAEDGKPVSVDSVCNFYATPEKVFLFSKFSHCEFVLFNMFSVFYSPYMRSSLERENAWLSSITGYH